jgi:hypothetical protein
LEVTPDGSNSNVTASVASGKFSAVARNTNTSSSTAALPGAAPLSPTLAAADVIAIYSDAYTQVASLNLFPYWGQPTAATEISFSGNKVEKYSGLTYEGIEFSSVNVSGMSKLHIDVWTPDLTALKVSIISPGKENAVTVNPTQNGWNSFDIDLAQYTVPDKANISQIKLEAGAPSSGTVYVDNIYFWKASSSVSSSCTGSACIDFSGSGIGFGLFENKGGTAEIANDPTNANNKVVKFVKKPADAEYFGTTITGLGGSVVLTAQEKTVSMRVWSPAIGTNFLLKFEGGSGSATTEPLYVMLKQRIPEMQTYDNIADFPELESFEEKNIERLMIFDDWLQLGKKGLDKLSKYATCGRKSGCTCFFKFQYSPTCIISSISRII